MSEAKFPEEIKEMSEAKFPERSEKGVCLSPNEVRFICDRMGALYLWGCFECWNSTGDVTEAGRQKLAFVRPDAGMAPTRKSQNNAKALLSYHTHNKTQKRF